MRRRALAEAIGTAMLVMVVVGSGIAAARLSTDPGLQLLENALATAAGLAVVILVVGPVSGAHLNPVVSLADWWYGGLSRGELAAYAAAQVAGGIAGCVLANLMYAEPALAWSRTERTGGHLLLAEVVATAGLLLVVVR
jgi:glycerol uptake facilitator-like aquaporin